MAPVKTCSIIQKGAFNGNNVNGTKFEDAAAFLVCVFIERATKAEQENKHVRDTGVLRSQLG